MVGVGVGRLAAALRSHTCSSPKIPLSLFRPQVPSPTPPPPSPHSSPAAPGFPGPPTSLPGMVSMPVWEGELSPDPICDDIVQYSTFAPCFQDILCQNLTFLRRITSPAAWAGHRYTTRSAPLLSLHAQVVWLFGPGRREGSETTDRLSQRNVDILAQAHPIPLCLLN